VSEVVGHDIVFFKFCVCQNYICLVSVVLAERLVALSVVVIEGMIALL